MTHEHARPTPRRAGAPFVFDGDTLRLVCLGSGFGGRYDLELWVLQRILPGLLPIEDARTNLPVSANFADARSRFLGP